MDRKTFITWFESRHPLFGRLECPGVGHATGAHHLLEAGLLAVVVVRVVDGAGLLLWPPTHRRLHVRPGATMYKH